MDLQRLKSETQREHNAVEGIMPVMNPDLTLLQYRQTLRGLYGVLKAWDDWAKVYVPAALSDQVRSRQRSLLLAEDLRALSDTLPSETASLNLPTSESGFLGAMYVIEGSTLGGQYIARHIEKTLGLTAISGCAYFVGYGEQTGLRWREFQDILRAIPEHHSEEVIAGARAMFTQFRVWMLHSLQS